MCGVPTLPIVVTEYSKDIAHTIIQYDATIFYLKEVCPVPNQEFHRPEMNVLRV
jgi:hypothetical protein